MVIAPKSPDERVAAHEARRRVMNIVKKEKKNTYKLLGISTTACLWREEEDRL